MWRRLFAKPSPELKTKHQKSRTSVDEEALADYVYSKVIYQAGVDFESKPMVIICACNLPDPTEVDYNRILERILLKLDLFVESDYTVVLFAGGAKHNPGWGWMFRAYKSLGRKYKKNLKSLYVVQPTTWARLYLDIMNAMISPKFSKKMKYIHTLSELAIDVPLTQIDIPPAVYEHNLKFEERIILPQSSIDDENEPLMFNVPIEQLMGSEGENGLPRVVKDCVTFLRAEGLYTEGVFRRSPSSVLLKQAKDAYDRGNPINLEDYGVHVAAVLLKMFFNNLPVAVFPVETYDILRQIRQRPQYLGKIEFIRSNIFPLLSHATILLLKYVCGLLVDISNHKDKNLMTSYNLAVMFAPNLVHSGNPLVDVSMCTLIDNDKEGGSGGVGIFMKLAINHFDLIFEGYEDPSDRIRRDVESEKTTSITNSSLDNNINNKMMTSTTTTSSLPSISAKKLTMTPPSTLSKATTTPPKRPSIKKMRSLTGIKTFSSINTNTSTSSSSSSSPTSTPSSSYFSPSLMTNTTRSTNSTNPTLCNSDPFRVGAGVEVSGIKVQGMVSLSFNNNNDSHVHILSHSHGHSSCKSKNSIDELRRANSYFY